MSPPRKPRKSITVLIDEPVADAIEHEAERQRSAVSTVARHVLRVGQLGNEAGGVVVAGEPLLKVLDLFTPHRPGAGMDRDPVTGLRAAR